ncbi:BMP family protein [Streptomyces sp. NPDC059506]|uniref:BMP family lipoprotein n=1 Tax=Streptomyces TaxID=1883 RepID=UPI000CCAAF9B|nr:BMP family ABC transporter substrate-binding protein [Streptomyces sp. SCUT-3]PLW71270.1 BMP family ABC transporter substrate-binding protein [Streptomyces sp. DJ]QMV22048.1 BMP family ABC transporter substrate-binding protein [Streptomyces sp. SCUT-3]
MRRVSKITAAVTTAAALALTATACGSGSSGNSNESSSAKDGEVKVGLVYDIGGRGDQSFNDAAYRGFDKALKEFDIAGEDKEPSDGESDADKEQRLTELARQGFNPVIGVGYAYAGPIEKVAKKFPDTSFAVIDDSSRKGENIANLVFSEEQGSYLVGVAAATLTKTDRVGFLGGVNTPLIQKFEAGFEQGVKDTNKDVKVTTQYISQPPDMKGFSSPADGKKVAAGMLDQGIDVIYPAAGASGGGAFEAIAAEGKMGIGVDSDQYQQKSLEKVKDVIITSMTKNVEGAVYEFIKSVVDGKPQTGVKTHDLSDDGVGYSKSNPAFAENAELIKKLEAVKKDIIDGKIEVKSTVS